MMLVETPQRIQVSLLDPTVRAPGQDPWAIGRVLAAMSAKHLGETFDIHAGGIDLIFPHHENEVAQSRCCFGTDVMANWWLHNGFLQVEGEKMSKSLGNFITIRDVLEDWPGEVVRLAMLKTHYRQPIDWTLRGLDEARRTLERWYAVTGDVPAAHRAPDDVLEPLLDDLNTPAALAALHRLPEPETLRAGANLLGFLGKTRSEREAAEVAASGVDVVAVEALIAERCAARAEKDWAASDRARDALAALGVAVKDNKDGTTTWTVLKTPSP